MQVATNDGGRATPSQQAALLKLLTDDDRAVYETIRAKILSYGDDARSWLQPHAISSDPVLRRRAVGILTLLARRESDQSFSAFCREAVGVVDIEAGSFLLARTQFPEANIAAYQALLDSYALEIRERLRPDEPAESVIATINDYLFAEQGYFGNETNYYDPDNSYLNRVMDRKTGNPISLCQVYLAVGRRLKLPLTGVGMPGHFVCRYQSIAGEFYIDAFNKGKVLRRAECVNYLMMRPDGFKESFLAPVGGRRILQRICANLLQIYQKMKLEEESARVCRYILLLGGQP